jgi:SAM-dependent methyltransferase
MTSKQRLDSARQGTWQVYQHKADQFDRDRGKSLFEKHWLDRFLENLPAGGKILDLGCGSGEPIAAYLINQGFQLTGVDYAPAMIELAQQRFPDQCWLVQDMRNLVLDGPFDGVISWNGSFHLNPDEQRRFIPQISSLVAPGGRVLLTVGHEPGEVTGMVAQEIVYHASLAEDEYRRLLSRAGFRQIEFCPQDPECNFHSILMAHRG